MTPVTIGDQKFIKDIDKGWIDAKTKQPADKGLIRLLDSLVINEPVLQKLRTKIDKTVEPVSIYGQKFVYDVNQGWVDEKTKVKAAESLQLVLNSVSPQTKPTVPNVSASLGIVGSAATQQTKQKKPSKTGGGTLLLNRNDKINKPIVAMINSLASIDGFLKQKLENQKIIDQNEKLAQRESLIEQVDTRPNVEVIEPDAKKVDGPSAGLLAVGGLLLLTLDPVQEALKDMFNGIAAMGRMVTGVVTTINDMFKFFVGGDKPTTDTAPAEAETAKKPAPTPVAPPTETPVPEQPTIEQTQPVADAQPVPQEQPATPVPQATPQQKPSFMSEVASGAIGGAAVGSFIPKVGAVAGAAIGGAYGAFKYFSGGSTPSSSSTPNATPAQPPKTDASPASSSTPTPTASKPVNTPSSVDATKAGATGEIPKNNIVALGNYLAAQGADKSKMEHHALSGRVGDHSTNSRHYRGQAIDVNFPGPNEGAILDRLEPQLRAAGYSTIWRKKGHKTHMHVSVGGPEGAGGKSYGDSSSPATESVAEGASNLVASGMEKVGELLGIIAGSIIKPGVPRDDIPSTISTAAKEMNADVAVSKTPKPTTKPAPPPSPPRINKKSEGATQNAASSADKDGVYYYLRRFGYQDLNVPEPKAALP